MPSSLFHRTKAVSLLLSACCVIPSSLTAQVPAYTLKSVAGSPSYSGGIALDAAGNIYICGRNDGGIFKVSPAGKLTAFAGGAASQNGLVGDGGPATKANLSDPESLAFDAAGNLFVADAGNNRIRKITTDGNIATVAGPGPTSGALGDGGPALNATLSHPTGVAVDAAGNLYIADSGHNRVRIVTPDGVIKTFAGTGTASDPLGDGGPASSAGLLRPTSLALDPSGDLYIADYGHNVIREVSSSGKIQTVAGNGSGSYYGDGGLATLAALNAPQEAGDLDPGLLHIALDSAGTLYIADSGTGRLRIVTPQGVIHTIGLASPSGSFAPGDTGSGAGGAGETPIGVAVAPDGRVYVCNIEALEVLTPTGATFTPLPFVTSRNSASGFGAFGQMGQGSWIEIYGSYLATNSRSWGAADFNGSSAPASLDGTSVTMGGQPAFISYISPGQINAQVPASIGTGSQPLIVKTAAGVSATGAVTVNVTQPGLLAIPLFKIANTQYVVALFPDGVTFVLPTGAIAGIASRPAMAGETIILYGIGFGPVTPVVAAGTITPSANALTTPLQVKVGNAAATVNYSGLTPGVVGLYQFNVVVPSTGATGKVPLTFSLGGVAGTQSLSLAVQ